MKWDLINEQLCLDIREWFRNQDIPEALCHALIYLIPKQSCPETVKHLRPISLCNTIYKLVTKIIVNRLKPLIPHWISMNQNSFIKGRGPEVNLVVAAEVLHSMQKKKGKKGWFALKVDLEKAYDRMEWSFIIRCLEFHNLDTQLVNLIMDCISKASSSVLINGQKTETFLHSRGLRQGDPMSPYIFNICLEYLTSLINHACEEKRWTPFWVGKDKVPVSHLLFADDLVLFGRVDEQTAFQVREVLENFSTESGQKINDTKSRLIFSPNTPEDFKILFQETINVEESCNLGLYLGLPISHKRPKRREVQFIVDKVKKRLASWKSNFLSRAGRLVLISSTLNTIPSYYMQENFLPMATLEDLDKACNNFLWGEKEGKQRLHLVAKETTFLPKSFGGLGIRDHKTLNKILMAKLGWRMCHGTPNLAKKCIHSKYVRENAITKFQHGSQIWQSIGKGWEILEESCSWNLGDGKMASFWNDNWLGSGTIRSLINGPLHKNESLVSVRDVWNNGDWDESRLSFVLPTAIHERLKSLSWTPIDENDTPYSSFATQNIFSLKKAYNFEISKKNRTNVDLSWIWHGNFPPKMKFFLWLCWFDRLPTNRMLWIRKIRPSPICNLCSLEEENTLHILSECSFAKAVWTLAEIDPSLLMGDRESWLHKNIHAKDMCMNIPWHTLFPFVCNELWTSRNKKIFEDRTIPSPFHILKKALFLAHEFISSTPIAPTLNTAQVVIPSIIGPNWFAVQVDASFVDTHNIAGIGGWIRDHKDVWILGFQKQIYVVDVLMAELMGILEGIY